MLDALEVCPLVKMLDDVCPSVVVLYTVVGKWEDVWLSSVVLYPVELTAREDGVVLLCPALKVLEEGVAA